MPNLSTTYSFTPNTVASSSEVNGNFSDIVNYINNRNSASATWDSVSISNSSSVPLIVNNSSGSNNIANFQDNGSNVFTIADGAAVMTLNSTGLGIGVSPSSTLHSKTTGDYAAIFEKSSTDANAWIRILNDARSYLIGVRGDTADSFVIYDVVANVERFRISSGGIQTVGSQSGARAYRNTSGQAISANTVTKVQFNAEDYDVQSEFDSSTNYNFTATATGKYLVSSNVFVNTATANDVVQIYIYRNGSEHSTAAYVIPASGGINMQIVDILNLSASDVIDIRVKDASNTMNVVQGSAPNISWLSVHKVS